MPTEAIASAAIPARIQRRSTSTPSAPTAAQITTSTMPVNTTAFAVASMPSSVSAHGAPR